MVCFTFLVYLLMLDSFWDCNWDIFPCSKNSCVGKRAFEKLKHQLPIDLARAVAYKINKCISSSAVRNLPNLIALIVGCTCHWLFVQKAISLRWQKKTMRLICRIIISPSFHYFDLRLLRLVWIEIYSEVVLLCFVFRGTQRNISVKYLFGWKVA